MLNITENDKFYIIWGSLNRPILWEKKTFLRWLLYSKLEMGLDCMIMKEKIVQRKMILWQFLII